MNRAFVQPILYFLLALIFPTLAKLFSLLLAQTV